MEHTESTICSTQYCQRPEIKSSSVWPAFEGHRFHNRCGLVWTLKVCMANNSRCKVQQLGLCSCNSWQARAQQDKSLILPAQIASPAGKLPGRSPASYIREITEDIGKILANLSKEQRKGTIDIHAANETERPVGSFHGNWSMILLSHGLACPW